VEADVPQQAIRKAYKKLTLAYHPDKNTGEMQDKAQQIFLEIVAAWNILGTPDKRAAFDDFGRDGEQRSFNSYWEYEQSGEQMDEDFYKRNPYITRLTPTNWERRLTGNSVWIVEFYAPWCGACKDYAPHFKEAALKMADEDVDFGAVNCAKHREFCATRFNIPSYPTIRAINRKHGTQQIYHDASSQGADATIEWSRRVANEWLWLFARANLTTADHTTIESVVLPSKDLWVIVFSDGLDCAPCKTAKTNAMRLSAGLRGLAKIGILDCDASDENREVCDQHGAPQPPHAPMVKAWRRGTKVAGDPGEELYNANEIEPHIALRIAEHALRLALADELDDIKAASRGAPGDFQGDEKEPEEPEGPPPDMMWNGPKRREALAWGDGGGQANMGIE